jgi:GNAT superfamily N-acetyltransferase/uncharacterized glyoxalase superfamily protein PhnB
MNPLPPPSIQHAEPVLAVTDVLATVNFYHEVLGFTEKWTWGEPPIHGGVSWNGGAFLQFSLNPDWAKQNHSESVWLRVKNIETLYELHKKGDVSFAMEMITRPWGFREYVVKDINGYYLTFAEPHHERRSSTEFPGDVQILAKKPSVDQLRMLAQAVNWQPSTNAAMTEQIRTAVHTVVAEDSESHEIIGCAFLIGDHKTFYYVKDVIVHPKWQGKKIGTALMKALMEWLENNGAESATVGLFTGDHLAPFYRQFGFTQACGMYRQVNRKVNS